MGEASGFGTSVFIPVIICLFASSFSAAEPFPPKQNIMQKPKM